MVVFLVHCQIWHCLYVILFKKRQHTYFCINYASKLIFLK